MSNATNSKHDAVRIAPTEPSSTETFPETTLHSPSLILPSNPHHRLSVWESECHCYPSWNMTASREKSENYSYPASHYPDPAPSRCLYIGHTEPILRVFYGRAIIPWVEEPPGFLFLHSSIFYFCTAGGICLAPLTSFGWNLDVFCESIRALEQRPGVLLLYEDEETEMIHLIPFVNEDNSSFIGILTRASPVLLFLVFCGPLYVTFVIAIEVRLLSYLVIKETNVLVTLVTSFSAWTIFSATFLHSIGRELFFMKGAEYVPFWTLLYDVVSGWFDECGCWIVGHHLWDGNIISAQVFLLDFHKVFPYQIEIPSFEVFVFMESKESVAAMYEGLRAVREKPDLAMVMCDEDAISPRTFTTNVIAATPTLCCKETLEKSATARAVLNTDQADAAIGDASYEDVLECSHALAELLQLKPYHVLIESTGVIGKLIKKEALLKSFPDFGDRLSTTIQGVNSTAIAIITTDLVSKSVAIESKIRGTRVRVGGMSKGSGMIHSNMAKTFGVVTTDASITSEVCRIMVRVAVNRSFSQIIVDGDTSTNDCVALANGLLRANTIASLDNSNAQHLQTCLDAIMQGLAKSIVWDDEGAACLIKVQVLEADTEAKAAKMARSVASSSLTNVVVYSRDPSWGSHSL